MVGDTAAMMLTPEVSDWGYWVLVGAGVWLSWGELQGDTPYHVY